MSKYAPIDILKLYAGTELGFENDLRPTDTAVHNAFDTHKALTSQDKWNNFLTDCLATENLPKLIDLRYRLQVGMDECYKKGLMTEKIAEMCVRWLGSIDKTARRIIKKKNPIPKDGGPRALAAKRLRDQEFEKYLMKVSY